MTAYLSYAKMPTGVPLTAKKTKANAKLASSTQQG